MHRVAVVETAIAADEAPIAAAVEVVRENLYVAFTLPQQDEADKLVRAVEPVIHMGMVDCGA